VQEKEKKRRKAEGIDEDEPRCSALPLASTRKLVRNTQCLRK
jgi:hypothetical protein